MEKNKISIMKQILNEKGSGNKMGILDRLKRGKRTSKEECSGVVSNAKKNSMTAVEYAKSFQKNFDFSERSIGDLEEILDYYAKDLLESRPTENQVWSMSHIFGSYLGEVMLKNGLSKRGYHWGMQNTDNIPLLMADDEKYVTPIDKIYKRLVNGAEDNVISFYQMMMEEG